MNTINFRIWLIWLDCLIKTEILITMEIWSAGQFWQMESTLSLQVYIGKPNHCEQVKVQ